MSQSTLHTTTGPYRAKDIRHGDPWELSNGHAIECMPTGGRGSLATGAGYQALVNDPAVEDVGIDTGFSPSSGTLRAPDLSVGRIPDESGWADGVPLLAVEYADTGQDEDKLEQKIDDLLAHGTRYVWVVRLSGPRRVEVHEPKQPMRTVGPGDVLTAPGAVERALPVEALYDREVAAEIDFRNHLERRGYASLEAVRTEGEAEGKAEGEVLALQESILEILAVRELEVSSEVRSTVTGCDDPATLKRWNRQAVTASSADALLSAS